MNNLENLSKWLLVHRVPRSVVLLLVSFLHPFVKYSADIIAWTIIMSWITVFVISIAAVVGNLFRLKPDGIGNSNELLAGIVGLVSCAITFVIAFNYGEAEKIVPSRKEKDDDSANHS